MAKDIIAKRCSRCHTTKPPSEFSKNSSKKDGLSSYCKDCFRSYSQTHVRRGSVTATCKHCGQDFSTSPYRISRGQVFCSTACYAAHRTVDEHARFIANLSPVEETGCIVWTAGKGRRGYGKFMTANQKTVGAHRFAWEMANGRQIPDGMCVCHRCDNPPCCNPDHLFLGTTDDNMVDRANKQRQARGDTSGNRKLSESQVRDIREKHSTGSRPIDLAREFGVSRETIHRVVSRIGWKHI